VKKRDTKKKKQRHRHDAILPGYEVKQLKKGEKRIVINVINKAQVAMDTNEWTQRKAALL